MLFAARARPPTPRLLVGPTFLVAGIVFLIGFRIALNITDANVIDVGYAGVIGADRITDPASLYGSFPLDNEHGDTYGPIAYAAYVPFEALLPWSGSWDDLPAAHAAALAFDLGCAALLWLLGRRLSSPLLGLLLAYLWLAFPFTLMVTNSGANDALVALLVLAALLAASQPFARGALVGFAGLTKFAPLALAPLFITYRGGRVSGRTRGRRGGRPNARAVRHEPRRSSGTARSASSRAAARRSRSGAATARCRRRRSWPPPRSRSSSPSSRAAATSPRSRRWPPPC